MHTCTKSFNTVMRYSLHVKHTHRHMYTPFFLTGTPHRGQGLVWIKLFGPSDSSACSAVRRCFRWGGGDKVGAFPFCPARGEIFSFMCNSCYSCLHNYDSPKTGGQLPPQPRLFLRPWAGYDYCMHAATALAHLSFCLIFPGLHLVSELSELIHFYLVMLHLSCLCLHWRKQRVTALRACMHDYNYCNRYV